MSRHTPSVSGWLAEIVDGIPHVTPINDLRPHITDGPCWCEPFLDGDVIVHNSLDQRERYERGERKPS